MVNCTNDAYRKLQTRENVQHWPADRRLYRRAQFRTSDEHPNADLSISVAFFPKGAVQKCSAPSVFLRRCQMRCHEQRCCNCNAPTNAAFCPPCEQDRLLEQAQLRMRTAPPR